MEADLSQLDPQDLRAAASHADPTLAKLLTRLADAVERGESLTPEVLGVDAQQLLAVADQLLPQLRDSLAPVGVRIKGLQQQIAVIGPLQQQTQQQLGALVDHIQDPVAKAHAAQALAQLAGTLQPDQLQRLLQQLSQLSQSLPDQLRMTLDNPGAPSPESLREQTETLQRLQAKLEHSLSALHAASASLGLSASAASQGSDPTTPLLLAARAALLQALDGDVVTAWGHAFEAAHRFHTPQIAQLAARPLLQTALSAEDYRRAALVQHMLGDLSPPAQRFDHRLKESLLLSKLPGFEDSIRALLVECQALADGIPQRARFLLTQGEILERLGDLEGAMRSWSKLIGLPNIEHHAPALQARGLAFVGEALLAASDEKAPELLAAAIDRGEACGDWNAVGYAAHAWMPKLRESAPAAASALAVRLRDIAGRLQPEALPALNEWLG